MGDSSGLDEVTWSAVYAPRGLCDTGISKRTAVLVCPEAVAVTATSNAQELAKEIRTGESDPSLLHRLIRLQIRMRCISDHPAVTQSNGASTITCV